MFCTKCIAPACCTKYFAPNVLHQMYCTSVLHQMFCNKCIASVCCTKCFAPVFCTKCIDRLHSHLLHQGWLHFFHTKKSTSLFFHQQQQPISFLPRKEFDQPGLFGHRITCRRQPPLKQSIKRWGNSTHRSTVSGKKIIPVPLGREGCCVQCTCHFRILEGQLMGLNRLLMNNSEKTTARKQVLANRRTVK